MLSGDNIGGLAIDHQVHQTFLLSKFCTIWYTLKSERLDTCVLRILGFGPCAPLI